MRMNNSGTNEGVVLALDIGSSSVRCFAYNNNQDVVARSSRERRSVVAGRIALVAEDDTESSNKKKSSSFLFDVIDTCVDDILEQLSPVGLKVVALGFSTFCMNLVGVDSNGELVGKDATLTYACSSRSVNDQVKNLKRELGEKKLQELFKKTGAPLHSAYALAQLRDHYASDTRSTSNTTSVVHKWQTIASVCLRRWLGLRGHAMHLPISYSEASWTGLINFHTCQYEPAVLELLPSQCRDALPDLADYTGAGATADIVALLQSGIPETVGTKSDNGEKDDTTAAVPNPYYTKWAALRGARFFLGVGDGACANIGTKCSIPNRIACTVGTSAAARVCLVLPQQNQKQDDSNSGYNLELEPGIFCYRIDCSHVLVGGALTDGGSVIEWFSQLCNLPASSDAFQDCLQQAEELLERDYNNHHQSGGGDGLTLVPFFSGERSTGFRTGATGAVLGLTRETTSSHLLKSCLEGVTLRMDAILQRIRSVLSKLPSSSTAANAGNDKESGNGCVHIICSGKALEVNNLWRKMLADCSDLAVVFDLGTQEGTSRGVAKLAFMALEADKECGGSSSIIEYAIETIEESEITRPCAGARDYWEHAALRQEEFINAVTPLY